MDGNDLLKQLADLRCKNAILEEKLSDSQYEVDCLQSDLQQAQSVIETLKKALEASRKENVELNSRGSDAEATATIEALREENRVARRRVTELEAEFRNLKIAQSSLDIGRIPDEIERQLQEWKRRLCLALDTSNADVFSIINDRLDRALMNDARANESEFTQQELKNQLRDAHSSANELANRIEVLLSEKEALKREANLWSNEKSDLQTTRSLLEQRIASLERQLEELRRKLQVESEAARLAKSESQQLLLERNSQLIQFNGLVEALAANLSTVESPCAPTEAAVKETVSRVMAELHTLKKAGADLENKVEQLLRQFESQFANGQSLCEELDALKRELDEEKRVKERIQCELEGLRLINSQKNLSPEKMGQIVNLCEKLAIPVDKHSLSNLIDLITVKITGLIDQGCISPECIQRRGSSKINTSMRKTGHTHVHENNQFKNSSEECPSCSHLHTTPLDLANRAPDWTDLEERRVQLLCATCLVCLTTALKQRLRAVLNSDVMNEKREKSLLGELENSKKEIEELHEKILNIENEKSEEFEKLEQMVSKLEALRQHQAKRIAGLQSKTQRQSNLEAQKAEELNAAKNFLIENRQKQLRLLNFRNTLGRLLGLDAWLYPNAESLIIQRVQQILMSYSAQGRSFYSQPMAAPVSTIQPSFSSSQLPALTYPTDEGLDILALTTNASAANIEKPTPSASANRIPRTRRAQSASVKNVKKY